MAHLIYSSTVSNFGLEGLYLGVRFASLFNVIMTDGY